MKCKKPFQFVFFLLTFSLFVLPAYAQSGFYGGIGYGTTSTDTGITAGTATLDEDDNGVTLFFGKKFDENISIEGLYVNLGEASLTGDNGDTFTYNGTAYTFIVNNGSLTAEASLIGVSGIFSHPLSSRFSVFAKLGLVFWDSEVKVSGSGISSSSVSDDGTDLFYGLGGDYKISNDWAVRGAYEIFNFDDEDADMISISAVKFF